MTDTIDFSTAITDLAGNSVKPDGASVLTIGGAVTAALLAPDPDCRDATEQAARFQLAIKINAADGPLPLSAEEVIRVTNCLPLIYGPLVTGRVIEAVDPGRLA